MSAPENAARPALRIVRGRPTPEELAVVAAVVAATRGGGTPEPKPPARRRWNDPVWQHGASPRPGAGAWVSSYR